MRLNIIVDGHEALLELVSAPPACRFKIDAGVEQTANIESPEPGVFSIVIDGRSYDAQVEESIGGGLVVVIDGWRFETQVLDPRHWSRNAGGQGADSVQQIMAPMPGKIVRILVAPGEQVAAGQGVVVVEAMKMQNEMKATRDGVVLAVNVKEGATVAPGEVLATIG